MQMQVCRKPPKMNKSGKSQNTNLEESLKNISRIEFFVTKEANLRVTFQGTMIVRTQIIQLGNLNCQFSQKSLSLTTISKTKFFAVCDT